MAEVTFKIKGIESFLNTKVSKATATAIAQAGRLLHSELRFAVQSTYNAPGSLDQALIGSSISNIKFAKTVASVGLQYKPIYKDLSKFPYSFYEGNIKANAKRPGLVHVVSVTKNNPKISYGKYRRGGFVPKYKAGNPVLFGKHGAQMFERVTDEKYPLKLVIGPSTAQLAEYMYEFNPRVKKVREEIIPNLILEILLREGF